MRRRYDSLSNGVKKADDGMGADGFDNRWPGLHGQRDQRYYLRRW